MSSKALLIGLLLILLPSTNCDDNYPKLSPLPSDKILGNSAYAYADDRPKLSPLPSEKALDSSASADDRLLRHQPLPEDKILGNSAFLPPGYGNDDENHQTISPSPSEKIFGSSSCDKDHKHIRQQSLPSEKTLGSSADGPPSTEYRWAHPLFFDQFDDDEQTIVPLSPSYASSSITNYRQIVAQRNRRLIKQHNSLPGTSFKMKQHARFADRTIQELQRKYLSRVSRDTPISKQVLVPSPRPKQNPSLTAYFPSFREKWVNWTEKGFVSPVKDQGSCGSCYAFAALADIESSFLFKGRQLDFSEQQVIDCSQSFGNDGCNGGWMANVLAFAMLKGITTEEKYPMSSSTFQEGNAGTCAQGKGEFKIKNYAYTSYRTYDCDGLTMMVEKRPVTVAVAVSFEFFFYGEGILTTCGEQINHGVQVTGLVESYPENYWIIKNSWGTWWGMGGFAHIDRYSRFGNLCEICYAPSYSIV